MCVCVFVCGVFVCVLLCVCVYVCVCVLVANSEMSCSGDLQSWLLRSLGAYVIVLLLSLYALFSHHIQLRFVAAYVGGSFDTVLHACDILKDSQHPECEHAVSMFWSIVFELSYYRHTAGLFSEL